MPSTVRNQAARLRGHGAHEEDDEGTISVSITKELEPRSDRRDRPASYRDALEAASPRFRTGAPRHCSGATGDHGDDSPRRPCSCDAARAHRIELRSARARRVLALAERRARDGIDAHEALGGDQLRSYVACARGRRATGEAFDDAGALAAGAGRDRPHRPSPAGSRAAGRGGHRRVRSARQGDRLPETPSEHVIAPTGAADQPRTPSAVGTTGRSCQRGRASAAR